MGQANVLLHTAINFDTRGIKIAQKNTLQRLHTRQSHVNVTMCKSLSAVDLGRTNTVRAGINQRFDAEHT